KLLAKLVALARRHAFATPGLLVAAPALILLLAQFAAEPVALVGAHAPGEERLRERRPGAQRERGDRQRFRPPAPRRRPGRRALACAGLRPLAASLVPALRRDPGFAHAGILDSGAGPRSPARGKRCNSG